MSRPLVEVREVDQWFRSGFWLKPVQVLHSVSLSIGERAVMGFLGPNGAGKTTLIHLIVGIRRPKKGEVLISGLNSQLPAARGKIGYLPERPYFYEHLTGEGVLRYFGELSGMKRPQIMDRIPKVLETVGMSHARHKELKAFSKGMLQRIGIAQAILHDPQFLVLDEPMSGLDPFGRKEIRDLIRSLASEGRTIFFSSHIVPDVEQICDQVALIQKGRIIGSGPIQQFLEQGVKAIEIGIAGVSLKQAQALPGAHRVSEIPEGLKVTVESLDSQNQVLRQVLAESGAKVLWVTPQRSSLEEIFVQEGTRVQP